MRTIWEQKCREHATQKFRKLHEIEYNDGFKQRIWFDNGYGISLVYHEFSYGLECALIHKDKEGIDQADKRFNEFCGGDSVKGYMNGNDLSDVLNLVKSFPG